jgi:signal transduction histidine kinase
VRQAVEVVGIVNVALFVMVALVAVREWRRSPAERTGYWAALAFVSLAIVIVSGLLLPEDPGSLLEKVLVRADLALFVLFPYFVYRFAVAFEPTSRPLARFVDSLSIALVLSTFALPFLPAEGESWPWWFAVYAVAFLVHWSVLLGVVAWRLWRASRQEAAVARRRMQMIAFAATAVVVALLVGVAAPDQDTAGALVGSLIGTLSGLAFLVGFAPPSPLRFAWRRPEQTRVQNAVGELMAATNEQDVVERVLPPMGEIVGARGIVLENAAGQRLGAHGDPGGPEDATAFEYPFGRFLVWTSPFAPYFGEEERKLLRTIGALTGLALDRARLFAQERQAREALEHADALKSEFVALAAHELRSPVAAIYGISETIAERGGALPPARLEELQHTLQAQIRRLRELVEQLLDLSRLDAEAVAIKPQRLRVRDRLERIVHAVAPLESASIAIEADATLEAEVDAEALERIVSNLLVNACRYGRPPVVVRAQRANGELRVTVEDSGPGVPDEFVPRLFERFAREANTAGSVTGTGLGLAIARAYARAHRGELEYRPGAPHGAAFEITLPASTAA